MLPDGWKRLTLGEIAQITSGGTPDRSEPTYWGGDIPWVTTGEIQFNTITHTAEKITETGLKGSSAKLFPPGTLLMAMYGQGKTRGQVAKLEIEAATNQACAAILLNEGSDEDFYFQCLASQYESIRDLGNAGTQKNLNGALIKEIAVPVPPFHEQQRISMVARTWDAAISVVEMLLANSRKLSFALIGETVMPTPLLRGRKSGSFPPSVQPGIPKLPPTPRGWRKTSLGEHLHEINRPVSLNPDCKYTLVTVRRSRGGVDERGVLLGAEIKTPSQFYVQAGDFLISKRQIVHGACGIVPPALDGCVVSNEYAVLGTDGQIDPRFLRYLSETTYFQQTCFHSSIGVHVEKMLFRLEHWLKWPFNIPPLDEQRRIVELLDSALAQTCAVGRQLELLRVEKRALMANLLTGKRRVRLPAEAEASPS
jgi:type I restriction enzyme S subunit